MLAEIEHQNYQAHLDSEQILAAITGLSLSASAQTMQMAIAQQATAVNDAITQAVTPPAKPGASTTSGNPSAAAADQAKAQDTQNQKDKSDNNNN